MNERAWPLAQETRALERGRSGTWTDSAARRIQGRYLRPHAQQADDLLAAIQHHAERLEAAEREARATGAYYETARAAGEEVLVEIEAAEHAVSVTHDSARRAHEFDSRAEQLESDAVAAARAADQVCAGIPGERGQTVLGISYVPFGDRERALSAARGLNAEQRALIASYTAENAADPANYQRLNPLLRVGTIAEIEQSAATITALQHAIDAAPAYRGTLYRGTTLTADQVARYRPGQPVVEQAFMSTSSDPRKEFGGNTRFVIDSQTGRAISNWSSAPHESEVIYGHSQPFLVVSNSFDAVSGRHLIVLQEIPR